MKKWIMDPIARPMKTMMNNIKNAQPKLSFKAFITSYQLSIYHVNYTLQFLKQKNRAICKQSQSLHHTAGVIL